MAQLHSCTENDPAFLQTEYNLLLSKVNTVASPSLRTNGDCDHKHTLLIPDAESVSTQVSNCAETKGLL